MGKIDIIENCNDCSEKYYECNDLHCGKTGEKININKKIPNSCPLPDAILSNDIHQDSEGNAVLENVEYNLEYVDSETIKLNRCR